MLSPSAPCCPLLFLPATRSCLPSSSYHFLWPPSTTASTTHAVPLPPPSLSRLPSELRVRNGCVFFQFKILSLNFLRVTAASGDFYGSDRIGRCGFHCSYAGVARAYARARATDSIWFIFIFIFFFFLVPSYSIPSPYCSPSASHYPRRVRTSFFLIALSRYEGNCAERTTVPS